MAILNPVERFGGVPFVDESFASRSLLAAVVAVRVLRAGNDHASDPLRWLDPDIGAASRQVPAPSRIISQPPTTAQQAAIDTAVASIVATKPQWKPLFAIPLRYAIIDRPGIISASSYGYPQHVFLGRAAFSSERESREQIIHETAHNWIYLIAEVTQLERREPDRPDFTLPSGTGHKQPGEVLGALHVALALHRYYTTLHSPTESDRERIDTLTVYIRGCAELKQAAAPYLTSAGQTILTRLHELTKDLP